ncbi:ABC transporter permease [Candidatus Uhrbacteria bacterium CG10_big_fil_rev_8_21_14_0_10_48_16]|uniref:Transport permease protein n=1 Tax=Candidatus Uhrbacteria bacterium CG10_big_fil_rev_8_21_14_0_10_48_16 TaxID=1975038 RepID=A0A2M8LI61_9BACT|nr:MAG: ABC transporter permease [Candidatus Uhrbacteria bacterium CG10_big_fil_rev_8_21_14_0_10_48_16]
MAYSPTIAYLTIARKEINRILRIWTQTLLPPVITQSLYFVIFGAFLGSRIGDIGGQSYASFIVPGLILMAVVTNAFSNVASSFFGAKFQRSIEEILVAPVSPSTLLAGFCTGGVVRSLLVGIIVFLISLFFVPASITHVWAIIYFSLMTAIFFSMIGFLNGMFARKFDDVSIIPTFVLTPLTYLGGVFYEISHLPGIWQTVARFNPLVYAIDGFRYGFTGSASTPIALSAITMFVLTLALGLTLITLLRKRVGLQS